MAHQRRLTYPLLRILYIPRLHHVPPTLGRAGVCDTAHDGLCSLHCGRGGNVWVYAVARRDAPVDLGHGESTHVVVQ